MTESNAPLLARALRHLRILRGRSQGDLAREAELDPCTVRRLESGDIELSRERLDAFGTLMKAKPGQVEMAIAFAATEDARYEALAADPRSALIEQALAAASAGIRAALEETRFASDLAAAKEEAAARWKVLAPLKPEDRLALVESCRDFRTPALCARLCDESERAASRSAIEGHKGTRMPSLRTPIGWRTNSAWRISLSRGVGNVSRTVSPIRPASSSSLGC